MARKRLSTPGFIASTKGHSVLRNKWYGGRALSPVDDLYFTDVYRPRYATYYDSTGTENEIRKNVNRELLFSTHAADDAFDVATKSKNRDQEILREASQAIVDTQTHASPKAAVASRRARTFTTHQHPTVVPRSYLPPKTTVSTLSNSYVRRPRKEVVVVSSFYRPRPASATDSDYRVYTKRSAMADWFPRIPSIPHYYPWWPYYTHQPYNRYWHLQAPLVTETIFGPKLSSAYDIYSKYFSVYPALYRDSYYAPMPRRSVRFLAIPLQPKRKMLRKAALVGSKVDVVTPKRTSRKPRSEYAATAMRRIKKEEREKTSPEEATSANLTASKPVGNWRRRFVIIN